MNPLNILEHYISNAKRILEQNGLETDFVYGKLYDCSEESQNLSLLIFGLKAGTIFDTLLIKKENVEYSSNGRIPFIKY